MSLAADLQCETAECFHCGLPVPPGPVIEALILGELRPMCCIGCRAVAEMLEAQGLADWYLRRETPTGVPANEQADIAERTAIFESPEVEAEFVTVRAGEASAASLLVEGLTCAACVWVIEHHLGSLAGVVDVRVGLAAGRVRVEWDPDRLDLRAILMRLAEIGFVGRPDRPGAAAEIDQKEHRAALIRLGIAGLGAMNVMTYSVALYAGAFEGMEWGSEALMRWMGLLVSTPILAIAGRPFFAGAWRDLRAGMPGMDVPIALAMGGAYAVSTVATATGRGEVYFDSVCMFVFFLSLGRFLELGIRQRSRSLTRSLVDASPLVARKQTESGERVVPAHALRVGDLIRVRPGETVPADGRVREGESAVEEALLTGECWPRAVGVDSQVVAGSQNVESPLLIEALRVGNETTLAAILHLVERVESARPPLARMADRVASYFVVAVLGIAAVNALAWYWIDPERVVWTTLAVLVATCPCALGLATPTAIAAAHHALARAGLLVTRAEVLEGLARADRVLFDKTGTLTRGQLRLSRVAPIRDGDEARVLSIAARLEANSEHPIARALRDAVSALRVGLTEESAVEAQSVRFEPGAGIEGELAGVRYRIGRPDWTMKVVRDPGGLQVLPVEVPDRVLLASESGPLAWFGFDDPLRPVASEMVDQLASLGLAVEMWTGDPGPDGARVASQLAFDRVGRGASPQDKVDRVHALQAEGRTVLVVGDGVNDGPLMHAGDVSVAMGSGCDLSRLGAGAVLLHDDLSLLPRAVACARKMRRITLQNFAWAVGYNLLALPLACSGRLPPWLAALGMSLSSLIVVLNALRLKRLPGAS